MTDEDPWAKAADEYAWTKTIMQDVRDEADRFWVTESAKRLHAYASTHFDGAPTLESFLESNLQIMNFQREREERPPLEQPA